MSSKRKFPGNVRTCRKGQKVGLTSQLEKSRLEEAVRNRVDRRLAWREEVRKELEKMEEFKQKMESLPLEDVEEEKKAMMSRLSLEWREAFKDNRASFLFPDVLKVMLTSEVLTKSMLTTDESEDALNIILKLRLVSKSVKQVIDDLHSYLAIRSNHFGGFRSVHITKLDDARNLTKKLGKVGNPFFFRKAYISASNLRSAHEFWKEIIVILARWGEGIWSVSISLDNLGKENGAIPNGYDLLVICLRLMPNLRSLSISISAPYENTDLNKLKDRIATNPLPELPYLRFASSSVPGPNIMVGVGAESWPALITYSILSRYNRNLESIKLASIVVPLEGHFPSLQKLWLSFQYAKKLDHLVDMDIFKGLNNWGTQLKELTLVVHGNEVYCHPERDYALNGLFLELPHLETISLRMNYLPLETLDILLPCKSLKTITYIASQYHDDLNPWNDDDEGIFQFQNSSNLYEGNVWRLLPELKLIEIDITTYKLRHQHRSIPYLKSIKGQYTRDGYQHHCKL